MERTNSPTNICPCSLEKRYSIFHRVVYRVGSSEGRESKANHPQTLIPLMIMEINLGSPQDASVAAPFHFSFHRCNDVPRVCLSSRLSFLLSPLSSLFLTRPPPSYAHARARRSLSSLSLALPSSITFVPPPPLLSPLPSRFFFIFASPRPFGSREPLLYRRFSTTLALPRSSNPPIVRFRRIRRTVMDYRSAHGRRSLVFPMLNTGES